MLDKKNIAEKATDLSKLLLTVAGAATGNPVIGASPIVPEYIYKILEKKGVISSDIDDKHKEQLDKAIVAAVEKTKEYLTAGNHRKLVSSIGKRLKLKLSKTYNLKSIESKIEGAIEDEKKSEGMYLSNLDKSNIKSAFYNIFLDQILKHEELRELVQITSIRDIMNELQTQGAEISQLKERIDELEKANNMTKYNFVITANADTKPTEYFVGRDDEIKELKKMIADKQKPVLVSGVGGIGKTHLCRYIFREYVVKHVRQEPTDIGHIGYFEYAESMNDTLLRNLDFEKTSKAEDDIETAWKILKDISAEKKLLIIVDNVTKTLTQDPSLKKLINEIPCTMILTSRKRGIKDLEVYKLGEMSIEKCAELFEQIYENVSEGESQELEYILETLAAKHTLTVEFFARMAKSKEWSIAELKLNLEEKHFNLSFIADEEKINIQNEYEKLFELAELSEAEINVLEAFSIFPPLPLSIEICNQWLNADAGLTEKDETFNILYQKGWLQKSDKQYSMHPIIAETILKMQQPKAEKHKELITRCVNAVKRKRKDTFLKVQSYIPYVKALAKYFKYEKSVKMVSLMYWIGKYCYDVASYDDAIDWYKKALLISGEVLGVEHPDTAACYNNIAEVHRVKGEYDKALEYYKKALYIDVKELGLEHPDTATCYNNIAEVHRVKGEYDKALEYYKKAIYIDEKVLGKEHPDTATSYNNLALVYQAKGEYEKVLELYKKALVIDEKVLGLEHPLTANTYNNIAGVYFSQREYEKALEWNEKALAIREKVLGVEHPDTANTYGNIASVYHSQGKYDTSLKWHKKALAILGNILGIEHPDTANTYNNLAAVYDSQEEYTIALEYYQKALIIREKVLGKEHPSTAKSHNNIAGVYYSQGEYSKALEVFGKAFCIFVNYLGMEHPDTKTVLSNMYISYIKCGRKEEDFEKWLKNGDADGELED